MNEFKIAFFGVKPWEREIIERQLINLDATGVGIFTSELHENIQMAKKYEVVSIFIYSKLNKEVLDQLPNLKMIATRSTGIDHLDCEGRCEGRCVGGGESRGVGWCQGEGRCEGRRRGCRGRRGSG